MADLTPVDYTVKTPDLAGSFKSGLQTSIGITNAGIEQQQQQLALQQQQAAAARQVQQRTDLAALASTPNPSARDYATIVLKYPELKDSFKTSWDALDKEQQQQKLAVAGPVFHALQSGRPDLAKSLLQQNYDALKASNAPPRELQAAQSWLAMTDHPELLHNMGGTFLASVMGPDFEKTYGTVTKGQREEAKLPSEISKNYGEASQAAAAAGKTTQEAGQVVPLAQAQIEEIHSRNGERYARLGLDADKLASETGIKLKEIDAKYGGARNMTADARKIVNEATANSVVASNSAVQMRGIADQFEKADPRSIGAGVGEALATFTGQQDYVSQLRKEYTRLRAGQVNALLPPGPASDKDIANAQAGFLPATANSKQVASFLRGMAKMQEYQSKYEDNRAQWVADNGTLGKAGKDLEIDGKKIPAGMTFPEFMKQTLAAPGPATEPPQPGAKTNYMDKYGKPKQANAPQG